ncbi:hypothetical protein ASPZODRAFT_135919 [Penicilliopsis zonata CBS 506.65]|uniref:Protein kinase domain-containing protein n=1 Tax=Penicilliopsis zonata CBS 506.65 TaxID=1073090 RepID=A0A1L9S9Q2_9EURO|nr:hypothetical protein ASPZODRAFT_135919 [Penicilliopsis zonata CBS 506.65]OJJ43883.1 hypothetical protein ASPZODRAFT_135919 [Penicilliopsis zonata CBS 506.65]
MCHGGSFSLSLSLSLSICLFFLTNEEFKPDNILLRLVDTNPIPMTKLWADLGEPQRVPILTCDGVAHDRPNVPRYLVRPIDFHGIDRSYIQGSIALIDFGCSFKIDGPHRRPWKFDTAFPYASPELSLKDQLDVANDLWALGCTLFELRTGRMLIQADHSDQHGSLSQMVLRLGGMPQDLWTRWRVRSRYFEAAPPSHGPRKPPPTLPSLHSSSLSSSSGPRSLRDAVALGLEYTHPDLLEPIKRDISEEEVISFISCLNQVLKYDPDKRLAAWKLRKHPWFSLAADLQPCGKN